MNIIDNPQNCGDPFADYAAEVPSAAQESHIHIRIQQRNGRKSLTTVQGICTEYDLKKITQCWKKKFACNGTVVEHSEYGEVIQLSGDQRTKVRNFLITSFGLTASHITNHGF